MGEIKQLVTKAKTTVSTDLKKLEAAARGVEADQGKVRAFIEKYPLVVAYTTIAVIGTILVLIIRSVALSLK